MCNKYIELATNKLGIAFDSPDLTFHQMNTGVPGDVTSYWSGSDDEDVVIIDVLIRKDSFFREYLPTVYTDSALFRFFCRATDQ